MPTFQCEATIFFCGPGTPLIGNSPGTPATIIPGTPEVLGGADPCWNSIRTAEATLSGALTGFLEELDL